MLEVVRDVIAVQQTNHNASDWNAVPRLFSEIESGLHGDDELDIARLGECLIRLGMVYQRIMVRTAESDVKRGKKVIQGARAAHVHTHGTAQTKELRWSAMNNQFLTHLQQGMGKMLAYRKVANTFGCSVKTVQRAVERFEDKQITTDN